MAKETESAKTPKLNPGDDAAPGTPGTGENVCPDCAGSGKLESRACPTCGGTGKVVEGMGGA
jgi:RecJ-like exonuclease